MATTFVSLVEYKGGSINYNSLSLEETPRDIYTVTITMKKNDTVMIYKFSSATFKHLSHQCIYTFCMGDFDKSFQYININILDIYKEFINIFNLMRMDPGRQITRIELNKEVYKHNFIISRELPEIVNISKYA